MFNKDNKKNIKRKKLNRINRENSYNNSYSNEYDEETSHYNEYYHDEYNDKNSQYDEYYYESFEENTKKRRGNKLISLSLMVNLIFILFIVLKGIFYIRSKIFILAIILFAQIMYYFIIYSKKKKTSKIIVSIIMVFAIFIKISFMAVFTFTEFNLNAANHENIKVSSEIKKADAFNIMLLGSDVSGNIKSESRNDVNILMSLSLKNRQMQLTNIPRDSYLPIALGGNNQYDKLTHAGNYGSASSMKTIENLFNSPVEYYAKINFTSFANIVDALDGIDVENTQEFTSNISKRHYPKGKLHLDGSQALDFVRQRYGLENGDLDRGKNQERAIQAILHKLVNFNTIFNYNKILTAIKDTISTNIPTNVLFNTLFEYLLSNGFDSKSITVKGTGESGLPSYSMPDYNLFMYVLDQDSVDEISKQIKNILAH